jgi:hypothetical protein
MDSKLTDSQELRLDQGTRSPQMGRPRAAYAAH